MKKFDRLIPPFYIGIVTKDQYSEAKNLAMNLHCVKKSKRDHVESVIDTAFKSLAEKSNNGS